MGEQVVQFASAVANQVRENLALFLALQIRARRRGRQVELRCIARVLGHLSARHFLFTDSIARRTPAVKAYPVRAGCMDERSTDARALLLTTTVPRRMSCRSRRRSLKKGTSSTNGVKKEIVNQNATACTAPSTK